MKITLDDITSGYDSPQRINANNAAIEDAIENTLSRDGTEPNGMLAPLDMNSNRIINLGAPSQLDDAIRLRDLSEVLPAGSVVLGQAVGTIGLTAVEGSLSVVARADSLPALSQAITPVWTGDHQWADDVGIIFGSDEDVAISFSGTTLDIDSATGTTLTLSFNGTPVYTIAEAGITVPRLITGNGAAATPSIRIGDEGDGFYREGSDALGVAVGATQVGAVRTSASGALHTTDTAGALFSVGYKYIPQNSQSGDYTLVRADEAKHIYHPVGAGAGHTYTIPSNASVPYPVGTAITFVNDSTNALTVAINSDTLVLGGAGTTGSVSVSAYGVGTALKVTSTRWIISGTGIVAA